MVLAKYQTPSRKEAQRRYKMRLRGKIPMIELRPLEDVLKEANLPDV